MNVEIGNEAAQFPEKKYVNGIFITVWKAARVIRIRSCLMVMVRIRIFPNNLRWLTFFQIVSNNLVTKTPFWIFWEKD